MKMDRSDFLSHKARVSRSTRVCVEVEVLIASARHHHTLGRVGWSARRDDYPGKKFAVNAVQVIRKKSAVTARILAYNIWIEPDRRSMAELLHETRHKAFVSRIPAISRDCRRTAVWTMTSGLPDRRKAPGRARRGERTSAARPAISKPDSRSRPYRAAAALGAQSSPP